MIKIRKEKMELYLEWAGYNQKEFAEKLGVDPSLFSLVLTGKRECSTAMMRRICKVAGLKGTELGKLFWFDNEAEADG